MSTLTVDIKEQDVPSFQGWLREHGYDNAEVEHILEWQKEEVLRRIASHIPGTDIPLEEAKARLFLRGK